MPYDLIIFDCDGVLVDSEPVSNRILADCFREEGFAVSYEKAVADYVGLSLKSVFAMAEAEFGRQLPDGFETRLQERTLAAFRENLQAVRGVGEVIDRLRAAGLPLCVASSGEVSKMEVSLGVTGLWDRLSPHIFSATQVAKGKPAPDLFLYAAAQMGAAPERCAVIEDSIYGVEAALAAGMSPFGYMAGPEAKPLQKHGAKAFHHMADLPALLGLEPDS